MGKPIIVRMNMDWNRIEKLTKDLHQDIRRIKSQSSPEKDVAFMNRMTKFTTDIMLCTKAEAETS